MSNEFISLSGKSFRIVDVLERISVADSFVMPDNKTGGGNGEAKLYVGQNSMEIVNFFGERGFEVNCFLSTHNLISYLNNAFSEYKEPTQNYRDKNRLSGLWEVRLEKLKNYPPLINFKIKDQNQLEGPRVYVNAANDKTDKINYTILRQIPLPIISYIDIYKLIDSSSKTFFYFTLHLLGSETSIDESDTVNADINKYIPGFNDIEKEISNEPVNIETPFDPNKIKVRSTPSSIGQIIDDLEDGFINLNTEFQRLPNLWNNIKKSRFIESLLLRLPIPAFYFNEKEENELEVIDGLQRISTIKSYVLDENLKLSDLEFLKEYNGATFSELPSTFQRRIKTFPITTYIIEKGTPNAVKYNIFKRVNTGGLELTDQEIRHAINQGIPAQLVADLARGEDEIRIDHYGNEIILTATREGKEFIRATDNRIGTFRMEDRDFVTRFVSFYLIKYTNYEPNLDTFLNIGMAKIRELNEFEISKLKDDFYNSMKLSYEIFGIHAFRKRFSEFDGRKPINKALFEVLSVSFAELNVVERQMLLNSKLTFNQKFIQLHNDEGFLRSITQGTAIKDRVIKRFQEIRRIIKETIENDN